MLIGDSFLGSEYVQGLDYTADIGLSDEQREQVRSRNAKRLLKL
ncbi:MAG: hypothetical protein ACREQY_06710 [Candidatus Binatia bacterium]